MNSRSVPYSGPTSFPANDGRHASNVSDYPADLFSGELYAQSEKQVQQEFLTKVYLWMLAGLGLTGTLSYVLGRLGVHVDGGAAFALALANFAIVFGVGARRLSAAVSTGLFFTYAAINGLLLSILFTETATGTPGVTEPTVEYGVLAAAFGVTAGTFGFMAVLGLTTKRDLSSMGSFLMMGVWGLILGSIIGIFADFAALDFLLLYGGLAIFIGLTAYFNWQLKNDAVTIRNMGAEAENKAAILGALNLYISFIAIFLRIVSILTRE